MPLRTKGKPCPLRNPARFVAAATSMDDLVCPETALVALCCAWPPSPEVDARILEGARKVESLERFEALVSFHRVRPLVREALGRTALGLTEDVSVRLRTAALRASAKSLMLGQVSTQLHDMCEAAGVRALVVKGAPLATLCYGSLTIKEAWDIDLLVDPAHAAGTRQLLIAAGYTVVSPDLDQNQFQKYVAFSKEAAFFNSERAITVELHWKLFDSDYLNKLVPRPVPTQDVTLPFGPLKTLSDECLFAYLALHGAHHNWFRLKWLADLHAFVNTKNANDLSFLVGSASLHGARRSVSVAFRLMRRLFLYRIPPEVESLLEESPITRALEANVYKGLNTVVLRDGQIAEDDFDLRAIWASFLSVPGASHFLSQAKFYWNNPIERAKIKFPRGLTIFYHLVRVPLWLARVVKRATSRLAAASGVQS